MRAGGALWRLGQVSFGEALAGAQDPAGAQREFEAALAIARALADARPDNRVWRDEADAIGARLSADDGAGFAAEMTREGAGRLRRADSANGVNKSVTNSRHPSFGPA